MSTLKILEDDAEERPFVEEIYRNAFDDVQSAIVVGKCNSGRDHFERHGRAEKRLQRQEYIVEFLRFQRSASEVEVNIERFDVAGNFILLAGWILDQSRLIDTVELFDKDYVASAKIVRYRRKDVSEAKQVDDTIAFGFFMVCEKAFGDLDVVRFRSEKSFSQLTTLRRRQVSFTELRDSLLFYISQCSSGDATAHLPQVLERGVASHLIAINRELIASFRGGSIHRRFVGTTRKPEFSLIVCIFGKPDFVFLQGCLFSDHQAIDGQCFEFVFVVNTPHDANTVFEYAASSSTRYKLNITVVILPTNLGFAAANNIGVDYAETDDVVILNPDVFPVDRSSWQAKFIQHIRANRRSPKEMIFGAPLLYDDGSVMHQGMSFVCDTVVSTAGSPGSTAVCNLLRVEHDQKGMQTFAETRVQSDVKAVTGAFMHFRKDTFRRMRGFDESFIFGHYEDADLCLRARAAGIGIGLVDVPFWHLEGKGSMRMPLLEMTNIVNRWYFSQRWVGSDLIKDAA